MRIIVMASSNFAMPALEKLYKIYDIAAIYTRQAKPSGRGLKLKKNALELFGEKHGIPVIKPKNFTNPQDVDIFKAFNADFAIVAAYGVILPQKILDIPKYGCINIHGSILPRWRGAAPIHRAIMAGDFETGVTIMQMNAGLDEGDIYAIKKISLDMYDTTGKIHDLLAETGADLLLDVLLDIIDHDKKPIPQDSNGITYAHKITKEEGRLDFTQSTHIEILRTVNAMNPFPTAWFEFNGQRYKLHEVEIFDQNGIAGEVTADFMIYCKEGAIRPIVIQRENKAKQHIDHFLNGFTF